MGTQKREYSRLINTIITLGSILIGLGILLFVASNWDKINRPAKILIIFSVISLFNLGVYYFRFIKNTYLGLTEGFCLIGSFAFGAGIWLIAQIYQIHYNFSAGILFWILGILAAAYIYRSWTVMVLSSILSLIWLSSYQTYYFNREAYGFFALGALIMALAYDLKSRFSIFIIIVSTCVWIAHFWTLKHSGLDNYYWEHGMYTAHLLLAAIYMVFGFLLYGAGMWQARIQRLVSYSFLYKFLGIVFIAFSTYSITFVHHYSKHHSGYCPPAIMALILILAVLSAAIISCLYNLAKNKQDLIESGILFYFLIASLSAIFLSFAFPAAGSGLINILLIVETLGFIYLGFAINSEGIFRLGILIFFIDVLSRYFDILWKMMPRSLLFIFGGALLIAGAVFADRKRRQLEEKMRKTPIK
ncbi:MAG: DUF2157 domain-containing protein [Candidatus Omnitrophica bacterium]|nr:DUF2157 domain-containing protein [Candidatus Omnitrophota bacterium]MDD5654871.1 DUF2157 domain-containing protein [Candidatus Omnitrophota bacterium]